MSIGQRRHAEALAKTSGEMAGLAEAAIPGDLCNPHAVVPTVAEQALGALQPIWNAGNLAIVHAAACDSSCVRRSFAIDRLVGYWEASRAQRRRSAADEELVPVF